MNMNINAISLNKKIIISGLANINNVVLMLLIIILCSLVHEQKEAYFCGFSLSNSISSVKFYQIEQMY